MESKFLRTPIMYKDESLISYLYRLAQENHVPFDWILEEIEPKMKENIYKFNAINDNKRIEKICKNIGITRDKIKEMTINRFCKEDACKCYN